MAELVDLFPTITTLVGLDGLKVCHDPSFKVKMSVSMSLPLFVYFIKSIIN